MVPVLYSVWVGALLLAVLYSSLALLQGIQIIRNAKESDEIEGQQGEAGE
jgi:hypothetical protein